MEFNKVVSIVQKLSLDDKAKLLRFLLEDYPTNMIPVCCGQCQTLGTIQEDFYLNKTHLEFSPCDICEKDFCEKCKDLDNMTCERCSDEQEVLYDAYAKMVREG